MSCSPEHAIREWLTKPGVILDEARPESTRLLAKTVRFVKHIDAQDGQLWYVTYAREGTRGIERWDWTVEASRDHEGRWGAHGVAGGGGSGDPVRVGWPWANLGGTWGSGGFRAGGTVEDAGLGITHVRMTDAAGLTFVDPVANSVVLFASNERVHMPMRVELIDQGGIVVSTDEWGFVDE